MKRLLLSIIIALVTAIGFNHPAAAQTSPVLIGTLANAPTATCATTTAPAGTWGISAAGAVTFNGTAQANTSNVVLGVCANGVFTQENSSCLWFPAQGPATAITWGLTSTTTPPAGVALPTCLNGTVVLSWIAPTTDSNGNPIPTTSGTATNAITGFNIYQGNSATTLVKVASVAATALTYSVTGLTAGTYYFAVTTVNAQGEGTKSNVVSGTMPASAPPPPAVTLAVPVAPTALVVVQ